MTQTRTPIGVLIMAYGGPDSLEEIPGYLADIRSGRPTTPSVLEEITDHYRRIGGRSPLLEISRRQVDGLAKSLGPDYACYLGMRHWSPWIEEVVRDMIVDGIQVAVSLVLTPQFSGHSVAKYQSKIRNGLRMYRGDIEFTNISSYHDHPKYIDAMAARVREGLDERNDRGSTHVVFSAHSLPTRIIDEGDPYDAQCRKSAALVAKRAGL
ncbi:MAG: ferrochelatase, partial [bacterium]|nr:ferrochelatase [bacterium]